MIDAPWQREAVFLMSRGEPLTTNQLVKRCYWEVNLQGEEIKSWHRANVTRVANLVGIPRPTRRLTKCADSERFRLLRMKTLVAREDREPSSLHRQGTAFRIAGAPTYR
jgi:hypothetical protein